MVELRTVDGGAEVRNARCRNGREGVGSRDDASKWGKMAKVTHGGVLTWR
jgi:hypothetical protein